MSPAVRCALILLLSAVSCLLSAVALADRAPTALKQVNYSQWQTVLASYKPDIVVVDMWATWCSTCLEQFPKMVELHKKYKDKGVRIVAMNLDDRNDSVAISLAQRFLQENQAGFDNYRMDEKMLLAFEKLGLMSIPAVIVYDRQGKEHVRLTGDDPNKQFVDADIEQVITALLQQNPAN